MKDIQLINKELNEIQKKKANNVGQLPLRPNTKQEQTDKKLIKQEEEDED